MRLPSQDALEPVRVGVTGHRILMDLGQLNHGIDVALGRICTSYPGRPLTLLTSLAEGADRLVAEAVLQTTGGRIVAVMPFPLTDYITDFGPEGSPSRLQLDAFLAQSERVIELPAAATRSAGYEQGGLYVLDHCDVLLAIWDGQSAHGQGGTADIVARARALRKPIVIVRAGNRRPGTLEPTTLGQEQGQVLVENLSG